MTTHVPVRPAVQVLLVCSAGGHLLQMLLLREAWEGFTRLWVTDDAADTRSLLRDERVVFGDQPSSRSVTSLVRNTLRAWHVLRRHRPRAIVTTGAAIALPFAWLGRAFGADVIFIESLSRISSPSLTFKLVSRAATRIYVQWPELVNEAPRARYEGAVYRAQ
jgi:beta-1,4-N-acetylglucosaminyltransferase